MWIHLCTVAALTMFLLISTRTIVYKRIPKTGKYSLSYGSLITVTSVITGLWYAIYLFFSKSTLSYEENDVSGEDIF